MMGIKTFSAALIFTLMLAGITLAQTARTVVTHDKGVAAHSGIDAIYQRFNEGYRALDPAMVAGQYTDDALYLAPGGDVQRGRETILGGFRTFFDVLKRDGASAEITFQILERRISGDVAYDVGIYTLTTTKAGTEPRPGRGKFVTVAHRMKDGTWRFHVDAYNDLPTKAR